MINATVIGNIGQDPELRFTQGGTPVLNFSVASNPRDKEKEPTWVRCAVFGKRAEALQKILTKGFRVAVVGGLELRSFETREGNKGTSLEMSADDVELLSDRRDGPNDERGEPPRGNAPPPRQAAPAQSERRKAPF